MIELLGVLMIIISIIVIYPYLKEKNTQKDKIRFDDKLSKLYKNSK